MNYESQDPAFSTNKSSIRTIAEQEQFGPTLSDVSCGWTD